MTAYLLDVNVLLALSWPGHRHHTLAQSWFGSHASKGWATCPMVEAGFVRIISNPAFSLRAVSPKEAIQAIRTTTNHPAHQFWPDDMPVAEALGRFSDRVVGHQQVTDLYLLGLAMHHRGKLVTLDRAVASLDPGKFVEVIA